MPKEKYSYAPEILEHSRRIGKKFDLYRDACFQTQIKEIRWNEDECRWLITTNRNDNIRARFVVMSNGPLNRPKLPGIPGIDSFKGHTFHTSRWDYGYTGGDTTGKSAQARRQKGRHHRDRRDCGPVRALSRQIRAAALCLPAHSVLGR